MSYLGKTVIGNFKPSVNPNKPKEDKRAKREGNSERHLKLIRQLSCCVSGRTPVDPHHLKIRSERGMGMRSTDQWAVPLHRDLHMDVEKFASTKELAWFRAHGIENPYELAQALWKASPDLEAMKRIVEAHRL